MRKVFLYLYPIEEYIKMFLFYNDERYDHLNIKRPLPILNETITKRYREKGYEVMFALYPDKEIFGIDLKENDKIIYTDVRFTDATGYNPDGSEKEEKDIIYPSEYFLLEQVGKCDELRIGGFHYSDCVKRVAEVARKFGTNTLVDLDLTDLFFNVYRREDYFKMSEYIPERYLEYYMKLARSEGEIPRYIISTFRRNYGSPVYGMKIIPDYISKFRVNMTDGYNSKKKKFSSIQIDIISDKYTKEVYDDLDKLIQEYCILKVKNGTNELTDDEKQRLSEVMNNISYGYQDLLLEYYSWCRNLCKYCDNESKKEVPIGPRLVKTDKI